MLANGGCAKNDVSETVALFTVKVALACKVFDVRQHFNMILPEIKQLAIILFQYVLFLLAMPSGGLCVALALLVRLLRRMRIINSNWDRCLAAWQSHVGFLAIRAEDRASQGWSTHVRPG